jgi:hypothetical protein
MAKEIMMADNKGSDPGAGSQANRQSANPGEGTGGSASGQYTGGAGAGTRRESGFISAPPESNVGPPGAPQSSHGSASGEIPGGTAGAAGAGQNSQGGMGGSAAGGNPGSSAGGGPGQSSQSGPDGLAGKKPEELTPEERRLRADTMPGDGPGDD